jgi:lipopolysaccharide/colanic/teichoic acid biosynthesis glycosyltransferase
MSVNTPPISLLGKKEVLLVGFTEGLEQTMQSSFKEGKLKFWEIRSSFSALQWLRDRKDWPYKKLPFAILVDYSEMKKEGFQLIKSLLSDPVFREIPLIGIQENGQLLPSNKTILAEGLDDCYQAPFQWDDLYERIKFLNLYKPQFKKVLKSQEPLTDYKIPRGKRIFDILIAGTTLMLLSPFLLLIAVLIKLESKGNIIYRSKRVGTGYDTFDFLKFRSMYPDADKRLQDLKHLNKYSGKGDDSEVFLKLENDPRITKVGKFIRKTSIDELPQLVNVLRGEMSIVGNRPLPLYEAQLMTRDQWANRFLAPAGITGLWQVAKEGKDNLTVEQRVNLDVQYANEASFLMDLHIMLRTLPAMLQKGE